MPSFSEIVGVIVTVVVLSTASGHGEWVWKGIAYVRYTAMKQARSDWGCPSLTGRGACSGYDPARYR